MGQPPYSMNVDTSIGRTFLNLIDTCFPASHHLHKLLNRNTIKISYSCMPNMKQMISAHNKNVLNKDNPEDTKPQLCNCRRNNICPLNGECLTSGVVYQASVTRQDNKKEDTYIGLTDNSFKTRYNSHNSSFRNESKRNATTLSQFIWSLKDQEIGYTIKWRIVTRGKAYSTTSQKCNLCIKEKYFIICKPHMASLNTRNELTSECRHRKRHLLCNQT